MNDFFIFSKLYKKRALISRTNGGTTRKKLSYSWQNHYIEAKR
jgi:hypothetical protein